MRSLLTLVCIIGSLFIVNLSFLNGLRIQGSWDSSGFFLFLSKFGFQRTTREDKVASRGYIYGNITSLNKHKHAKSGQLGTLVLVDSDFFLDIYGNASRMPRTDACRWMFSKMSQLAWHSGCNPRGKGDFLRSVPCVGLCAEEDDPHRVIKSHQLTYIIQDVKQPRYWYMSLVACVRNETSCEWQSAHPSSSRNSMVNYDLWLVNGDPHLRHFNKFEHQFSFDNHDTIEIFLVFTILYFLLAIYVQLRICSLTNVLTIILSVHLWVQTLSSLLSCIHLLIFANNGVGLPKLGLVGQIGERWSDCFLLLLLVTIAEQGVNKARPIIWLLVLVCITFLTVSTGFYLWAQNDIDPVLDLGVWDTVPGCLLLASRFVVAFWFLAGLRSQSITEVVPGLDLLHFGAGYLLWFLALPIIVLVSETSVSSLWREKTILSVTYCSNFVAASGLVYIFWRSKNPSHGNL